MGHYEFLDHTADIALSVSGDSVKELFKQAFNAFGELTDVANADLENDLHDYEIEVTGIDNENLLVRFLNDLIMLIQELELAPLELREIVLDDELLKCNIVVKTIINLPESYVEMKAATYHMLEIKEEKGILSARIIIDI